MFCVKCGTKCSDDVRFCPACGAVVQEPVQTEEVRKPVPRKFPVKRILVFLVVIALVFTGIMVVPGLLKNGGAGNKSGFLYVVHPEFQLTNEFIMKVDSLKSAPEGFIPISTPQEFDKIRLNTGANYILMNDIELLSIQWESIKADFTGILNGNGYMVANAKGPLFDCVDGGTIENLGRYENVFSVDGIYGCSIAKEMKNGTLSNCFFEGSIKADCPLGGLVCSFADSTMVNCYNKADLTGTDTTGGLIGYASGTVYIGNCFNEGKIICNGSKDDRARYAGGLIGRCRRMEGSVIFCYNSGSVTCNAGTIYRIYTDYGDAMAGGITAVMEGLENDMRMEIRACYNSGTISGGDIAFGICAVYGPGASCCYVDNCYNCGEFTLDNSYGIAGCVSGSAMFGDVCITNCYNLSTTGRAAISNNSKNLSNCYYLDVIPNATADSALFAEDSVKKLTYSQMKRKSSFQFDFDYFWDMGGSDYPYPVLGIDNL